MSREFTREEACVYIANFLKARVWATRLEAAPYELEITSGPIEPIVDSFTGGVPFRILKRAFENDSHRYRQADMLERTAYANGPDNDGPRLARPEGLSELLVLPPRVITAIMTLPELYTRFDPRDVLNHPNMSTEDRLMYLQDIVDEIPNSPRAKGVNLWIIDTLRAALAYPHATDEFLAIIVPKRLAIIDQIFNHPNAGQKVATAYMAQPYRHDHLTPRELIALAVNPFIPEGEADVLLNMFADINLTDLATENWANTLTGDDLNPLFTGVGASRTGGGANRARANAVIHLATN